MPGRIEIYQHSDSQTTNKGAAVVHVMCQTDFAAKTTAFIAFSKFLAKMAYATSAVITQLGDVAYIAWEDVITNFPEVASERERVQKELKEQVQLKHAVILAVQPHWSIEGPDDDDNPE